jgi:PKD repeat protein
MRTRAFFLILLIASWVQAVELPRPIGTRRVFTPRLFTMTPYSIHAGQVTDVLLRGDDLVPGMNWKADGLRVLKQQWIDIHTVVLTVFAQGDTGIRSLRANDSLPLSFEVLSSTVLLSDDFNDGDFSDWVSEKGDWTLNNDQLQVIAGKNAKLFSPLGFTDNVNIDFDLTVISGKRAGIFFHYRDKDNYRLLYVDSAKKKIRLIDRFAGKTDSSEKDSFDAGLNTPHHFSIAIQNNNVSLSADGNLVFDKDLPAVYSGSIAFYAKASTALFDNILVTRDPNANAIPTVDFTTSVAGRDVSVNGSASIDPDGTISAFQWKFGDTATGTGSTATHKYSSDGSYLIVLSVTDNAGATTKKAIQIKISAPLSDKDEVKEVVAHFFELLKDLETLTGQQICTDFSKQPNCPAYAKQVKDLNDAKPGIDWFDVEFLSDVSVSFKSATDANPVRIRNLLKVRYNGDPTTYWTDGWHIYDVKKEADGNWHQCSYTFDLVAESQP